MITRRHLIGGTGAVLLASAARPSWASLLLDHPDYARKILSRHWAGGAAMKTSATSSGELVIGLSYDFDTSADLTFTALCSITSRWNDGTYRAQYQVGGKLWGEGDNLGVDFQTSSLKSADALPSNLYWQALKGRLELVREDGTEDNWLLGGTLYGTVGGDAFETQLSDHS